MEAMIPGRPDYKSHHLWEEAMALVHEAYGLADQVRAHDPEAARLLRKAAVSVPAHVAGALTAGEEQARATEVSGARAALADVAARAEVPAPALSRRARALDLSVELELGPPGGFVC
jgi:purine nucleoside permease